MYAFPCTGVEGREERAESIEGRGALGMREAKTCNVEDVDGMAYGGSALRG